MRCTTIPERPVAEAKTDRLAAYAGREASSSWMPVPPVEETVTGTLGYLESSEARPAIDMYERGDGRPQDPNAYDVRNVDIRNARRGRRTRLHSEGFELWHAPSVVRDFHDDDEVVRRYYPETVELACLATGASRGYVFDHTLRQREVGRPALTFGRHGNGRNPAAVGRIHNDYTEASGLARLGLVLEDRAAIERVSRFAIVNIWRSIAGPVVDTPLAVCDARTVSSRDFVSAEIRYQERSGEIYLVTHAPGHRWCYFPEMDRDEVLIFKQYDSQISGTARFTPHAAFDLPAVPDDAPLRQSVEVRCLVVFDRVPGGRSS